MEVKSDVLTIEKLKDNFFIVPDYQREYVWKSDDHVERFLEDIDNETLSGKSYFIGSIIIVENTDGRFDVIDGQQRLTTIVLTLCALRNILEQLDCSTLDAKYQNKAMQYLHKIRTLLYDYNMDADDYIVRLELQYEESKEYLTKLIKQEQFDSTETPSIIRMREAYQAICDFYQNKIDKEGIEKTIDDIKFFLTKVEIVVIKSENLSSALKIFETINQRGSSLNAMDLIKNLLFSNVKDKEFNKIKDIWKDIPVNLQNCKEDNAPTRFLRYFFLARYYDGKDILREDDIYKWLISPEGKMATQYEVSPIDFAKELSKFSKLYSDLVLVTERMSDSTYPNVARIGRINKLKSRQHLILILALKHNCDISVIEYLAKQIESYFFYCVTMRIQAKDHERYFTRWAKLLRNKSSIDDVKDIVNDTIAPFLKDRLSEIAAAFLNARHDLFNPGYRQRFVLSRIEETIATLCNLPIVAKEDDPSYQIEHIMPQTPKDNNYIGYPDETAYYADVYRLGNVTLLEGSLNQAINKCHDLSANWFVDKQSVYEKSSVVMTKLLDANFMVGKNTAVNRFKSSSNYNFTKWNTSAISERHKIMYDIALDTWKINDARIDE